MDEEELGKAIVKHRKYNSNLANIISFEEFDRIIEKNSELLDFLGDSAYRSPIINIIGDKTYTLSAEFLLSTSRTLKSISACCRLGSFTDANMLVRKYRDDLFLYLYIIESSNNAKDLTDKEYNEIINGEMNEEKFIEIITLTFSILSSGIRKDKQDKAIDAWFDNAAESGEFYKFLDIKNYLKYLKANKLVRNCIEKYGLDDMWMILGRKQNNYTHNNGKSFLTDNIVPFHENKRVIFLLEQIHRDITFITSYFLAVLILIQPDYIASFDYIHFLENGLTPPENSQYRIASIVQEYIDEFVISIHPDLKSYLRDSNPCGMNIV